MAIPDVDAKGVMSRSTVAKKSIRSSNKIPLPRKDFLSDYCGIYHTYFAESSKLVLCYTNLFDHLEIHAMHSAGGYPVKSTGQQQEMQL